MPDDTTIEPKPAMPDAASATAGAAGSAQAGGPGGPSRPGAGSGAPDPAGPGAGPGGPGAGTAGPGAGPGGLLTLVPEPAVPGPGSAAGRGPGAPGGAPPAWAGWGPVPGYGPVPPTDLQRWWPGPARAAAPAVPVATAAGAAVAAVSIPLDRPGLGWLLTAVAAVAAVAVAARASGTAAGGGPAPLVATRPARRRFGADQVAWTAATVVLLGTGTVRAAGWLFFLCLLTAGVTACPAIAGGRSTRGLFVALVVPPLASLRALSWAGPTVVRAGRSGSGRSGAGVLATAGLSLVLLTVFGALFASADAAFATLLARALPEVDAATVARWIFLFVVVGLVLLGAAYVRSAPPDLAGLTGPPARPVRRLEWAVPLAALNLLFTVFVLVQLTVLFGGAGHVLRQAGLTYAEYARHGFWQLLSVTALTLLVLVAAARWAPRATRTDRALVRVLLGGLAALTLVVVASALYRMDLYADVYGLTRLRLLVAACELWLGLVFLLVLLAGLRWGAAWLPRTVVATAVLTLVGLVAVDPDRLIATHNVDRYERTGRIDVDHVANLSADAAPALDRLPARLRDCALRDIAADLASRPDDWRELNLGRQRARALLAAAPPDERASCAGVRRS